MTERAKMGDDDSQLFSLYKKSLWTGTTSDVVWYFGPSKEKYIVEVYRQLQHAHPNWFSQCFDELFKHHCKYNRVIIVQGLYQLINPNEPLSEENTHNLKQMCERVAKWRNNTIISTRSMFANNQE